VKNIEDAIAEFTEVIQKTTWSATADDKPQTKYPEYPWEVKDPIKEKRKLRTLHNTTLQYMRLTDHVTLNLNNNISMAAVSWMLKKPC
jgi:hypothetical protein